MNANIKTARTFNMEVWGTGGGCEAFGQVVGEALKEKHHVLVTGDDGISIDGNPDKSEWIVGLYNNDGDFINFTEQFTLRGALDAAFEIVIAKDGSDLWGVIHDTVAEYNDKARAEIDTMESENNRLVTKVAKSFSHLLLEEIGRDNLLSIIKKNKAQKNGLICYSHDYCDANMIMEQALEAEGVTVWNDDEGTMRDDSVALWNDAWNMAKAENFFNAHLVKGEKT